MSVLVAVRLPDELAEKLKLRAEGKTAVIVAALREYMKADKEPAAPKAERSKPVKKAAEDPRFANVDGVTEHPKLTARCPKPGHLSFKRNGEWMCLTCEKGE